jgi:hypothetical protein
VQTPDPLPPEPVAAAAARPRVEPRAPVGVWAYGETLAWVSGLVLSVSAFTGWYSGQQGDGLVLSVMGWNTGALGKLVFFAGLLAWLMILVRNWFDLELPAAVPESLVLVALGSLATIFVLIRLISIPDTIVAAGRGIGIWISLLAALAVIVAGLLRASEEL